MWHTTGAAILQDRQNSSSCDAALRQNSSTICWQYVSYATVRTCAVDPAGLVKTAGEQLQTDDGVDDDDEDDEQRDVKQRHHSFENRIQHNLKTCIGRQQHQSLTS